mgnify:CR=1 FL=1
MRSLASTLFIGLVYLLFINGPTKAFAEDLAPTPIESDVKSRLELTNRIADEIKALRNSGSLPPLILKWPKADRENFLNFYAARNDLPLWFGGVYSDERRESLKRRLLSADEDGLIGSDYPTPLISSSERDPRKIAEADLILSASATAFARDARGARIDTLKLSKLITPKLVIPHPALVLADLVGAQDVSDRLESYQPRHKGYLDLKTRLIELRETTGSLSDTVVTPKATSQKTRTTTAMVSMTTPIASDLIVNMERWRWVPPELGEDYIFVNLPEFTLKLIRKGELAYITRTVVGKPDTPTPLFSAAINSLIVNPSWHVPQSIIRNEFLPKLAEDPAYAEKSGYEITQNGDMISIRQPPGERNALGFVKFNLPNEHAVYLHDTPMRKLFANMDRAYSHGCVRVENPFSLAAMVLSNPKYSEDTLKSFVGHEERMIKLEDPLPVHLTYFTVITGEDGQLRRLGDIYGYDNLVLTALKLDQHRNFAALK